MSATTRTLKSQSTSQCLPLICIGFPEDPEAGAARPGIACDFLVAGGDTPVRPRLAQRFSATGTDRLARRADAAPFPFTEECLDQTVFA